MLKVLAACGSGMGSSQIIKMKIEKVFKKHNIPITIHHCSVSEAKSLLRDYDVVISSLALIDNFKDAEKYNTIVIGLRNLLSEQEIEEKIVEKVINRK
ncbi:PTS sugar transporter subunit IIB [Youngiibacter fragilis]|uniref:PTS ascorbate transporter subunit IIB n=1 Tax=Youngiibacter fragilis 232.1 TaxID=994573 RepID=V7I2Q9_9CLOT|nr:PTS sugar transporter subunit IIB [Youngiibacter fragilis]ETA80138.1 PTS ascorbate transporter subunit IIB [Youngiibacter fragilis 232.1]